MLSQNDRSDRTAADIDWTAWNGRRHRCGQGNLIDLDALGVLDALVVLLLLQALLLVLHLLALEVRPVLGLVIVLEKK